jgi:RimJ/RimL family protein N-acetyltransferase
MNTDMTINIGKRIRLTGLDEKDAEIQSRWTHDGEYLRMLGSNAARPISAAALKKRFEAIEKDMDANRTVYFAVRTLPSAELPEETLIGFAQFLWINWASTTAQVMLGIADPRFRGCGYGTELLGLVLQYSFQEMNLHRLGAVIPEYNRAALRLFSKLGFVQEARRRKAIYRDGKEWDLVHVGILRREWELALLATTQAVTNPGSDVIKSEEV